MGLTGSQTAIMPALFGSVARFGATRFGYVYPRVSISVDGIQRGYGKVNEGDKIQNLSISETTGSSPNTATFEARGFEMRIGMPVIATLGTQNRIKRLFAGSILNLDESNIGSPDYRVLTAQCVDWTWALNIGEPVLGHFTGSADEIALELMDTYAPDGFTTVNVEAGLPTVTDGITFTNVLLSEALAQLAKRREIGATQFVDYQKDLSFRVTPLAQQTMPRTLTRDLSTLKQFRISRELSQVFNRVHMEGGGTNAAADVEAGETILPLTSSPDTWYSDVGGVVISGPQRISYTGRFVGGGGSLVGTGHMPATAPTLALASGAGVTTGPHGVTVVFETAAGTSLPGPEATITVGLIDAPTTAPTVGVPTFGVGPNPGAHQFAVSNVTAAGETTPTPLSAVVTTIAGITDPSVAPTAPTAPAHNGFGDLVNGNSYSYKYTWGNANGDETLPSPASSTQTVGVAQRLATGFPSSTDVRATRIYLYRSANGGGAPWTRVGLIFVPGSSSGQPYYTSFPGVFWTVDDSKTPITVAAPTANTAKSNAVPLTGIPNSPSPLVTSKNLYGTAAGGSQLKLIAALTPLQTSYTVTMLDAALGANAPTTNTAAANQITTSAPLGPATTTARRFYMSLSTGGARKLALTIANNTAITGTITASDATLAAAGAEPSTDTSGLAQPAGQVLAGATSILVAGLGGAFGFSEDGGWAIVGNGHTAVRYAGIFGSSLVGIPPTGSGSIAATINYGSQITASPAVTGAGYDFIGGAVVNNTSRALRLLTGTPTDRLGSDSWVDEPLVLKAVTLKLSRVGAVVGNVWVTIRTAVAGTVYATSSMIDASTIATNQSVTFVFSAFALSPTSMIVLEGDYSRSDSVYIAWHGNSSFGFGPFAWEWDGTTTALSPTVDQFWCQMFTSESPILYTIHKGDPVNLWVTVDDTDAQAYLADLLGDDSDGVKPTVLQDRRLSIGEALARAAAHLELHAYPEGRISGRSKDGNFTRGAVLESNLEAPTAVIDEFKVKSLTIDNFTPNIPPDYAFTASTELYTLEQLLLQGRNP